MQRLKRKVFIDRMKTGIGAKVKEKGHQRPDEVLN